MKIRHLHLLFGVASLCCLAAVGASAWQQHNAAAFNETLRQPPATLEQGQDPVSTLAHGVMLAAKQNVEGARQAFQQVLQDGPPALQQVARYNLGNLHLREAIRIGPGSTQTLPLVEQAKQRYREVLAADPNNWDARYNLERALWLSPETETTASASGPGGPRTRVVTAVKIEPGELP